MKRILRLLSIALAFGGASQSLIIATRCDAAVRFEFDLTYDPGLFESSDFLSDLSIVYFVNEPGYPYTNLEAVSYFYDSYQTIPIAGSSGFHHSLNDPLISLPDYAINYAILGIYNDVDTGAGPSIFCAFSDSSAAVGKSYDEVFGGLNAVGGPYTEEQVLTSLTDPLGLDNPDNYLVFSYFYSYILDNPSIATLFDTPVQEGQSNTMVHFSDGTAFGIGTANASAIDVPEPATWLLATTGLVFTAFRRRANRRRANGV